MKIRWALVVVLFASLLTGCVATMTPDGQIIIEPAPIGIAPTYAPMPEPYPLASGDDFVPPQEFIEGGAPVYYDAEPGVAFYPMFLGYPGSCFCIMPVRYYDGAWLGVGGAVVHRGNFPFHHAGAMHRDVWNRSGGVMNGHAPMHGHFTGGRAVPPPDSLHSRGVTRPNSNAAQHPIPKPAQVQHQPQQQQGQRPPQRAGQQTQRVPSPTMHQTLQPRQVLQARPVQRPAQRPAQKPAQKKN